MTDYLIKLNHYNFLFEKNKYIFFKEMNNDNFNNDNLNLIIDIIEYSKPKLNSRLEIGNLILKNNKNQLLF